LKALFNAIGNVIKYLCREIPFLSKIIPFNEDNTSSNLLNSVREINYLNNAVTNYEEALLKINYENYSLNASTLTTQNEIISNNATIKLGKETKCLSSPHIDENNKNILKFKNNNNLITLNDFNSHHFRSFSRTYVECSENVQGNYQNYVSKTLESMVELQKINYQEVLDKKIKYDLKKSSNSSCKRTLILDLDETLVHSNWGEGTNNGQLKTFKHLDNEYSFELFIRPWVPEFLKKMNETFDIYIFTAGRREYANIVIDIIDPEHKLIKQRFYREDCIGVIDKAFIKDLRIFNNINLEKTLIVDNSMYAFQNQLSNGVLINSFYGDPSDSELLNLTSYIQNCIIDADAEDVRKLNNETFGFEQLLNEMINEKESDKQFVTL